MAMYGVPFDGNASAIAPRTEKRPEHD